ENEPDQPHGDLGGGWVPGSLAEWLRQRAPVLGRSAPPHVHVIDTRSSSTPLSSSPQYSCSRKASTAANIATVMAHRIRGALRLELWPERKWRARPPARRPRRCLQRCSF